MNANDSLSEITGQLLALTDRLGTVGKIVQLAITVLTIVSMWIVYQKAGEAGWKIFIPIYGDYIRFKIAHCAGRFWTSAVLNLFGTGALVYSIFQLMAEAAGASPSAGSAVLILLLSAALLLIAGTLRITVHFKMAVAFRLPGIFGLGLWLLPTLFYAILAFNRNIRYEVRQTIYPYL